MRTIYVTFAVPHLFQEDEKCAVACKDMAQALEVAQDANSLELASYSNVHISRCVM